VYKVIYNGRGYALVLVWRIGVVVLMFFCGYVKIYLLLFGRL